MKADDKSHLSTSNYVCLFECLFVFNFKNNLQLTFLVLPSSTLRYFPCQVKYLYSLTLNVFYCRHFLPISFQFSWFLHLSQAHSVHAHIYILGMLGQKTKHRTWLPSKSKHCKEQNCDVHGHCVPRTGEPTVLYILIKCEATGSWLFNNLNTS